MTTQQTITSDSTLTEVQSRKQQVSDLATLISSTFSLLSYLASYENPMAAEAEVRRQLIMAYDAIWKAHQRNHEIWITLQAQCDKLKEEEEKGG